MSQRHPPPPHEDFLSIPATELAAFDGLCTILSVNSV